MKAQIQIVYFNSKATASNTRVFGKTSCINNWKLDSFIQSFDSKCTFSRTSRV